MLGGDGHLRDGAAGSGGSPRPGHHGGATQIARTGRVTVHCRRAGRWVLAVNINKNLFSTLLSEDQIGSQKSNHVVLSWLPKEYYAIHVVRDNNIL